MTTAGMDPAAFATTPEAVAAATEAALSAGDRTVWVLARLELVFAVLRHLPGPVWRCIT